MSEENSTFRGYHAIGVVVAHLTTLAQGLAHRSAPSGQITLSAKDFDLIARWPKAAAHHEIFVQPDGVHWHGFTLRREHNRPLLW